MRYANNRKIDTHLHATDNCVGTVVLDCRLNEESFYVRLDIFLGHSCPSAEGRPEAGYVRANFKQQGNAPPLLGSWQRGYERPDFLEREIDKNLLHRGMQLRVKKSQVGWY